MDEMENLQLEVKVAEDLLEESTKRMIASTTSEELGKAHSEIMYFSHDLYAKKLRYLNYINYKDEK